MATVIVTPVVAPSTGYGIYEFGNIDVDALEEIGQIDLAGIDTLWMEINNIGVNALTAFEVSFKVTSSGNWQIFYAAAGDYLVVDEGPLKGCIGDPTGLLGGASAYLKFDVGGLGRMRIRAAGTNSVVNIYARGA